MRSLTLMLLLPLIAACADATVHDPTPPAPAPEPAAGPAADEEAAGQAAEQAAEQAAAKAAAEPFAPSEADTAADEASEAAETPAPAEPEPPAKAARSDAPAGVPAGAPAGAPAGREAGGGERVSRRAFAKPARPQSKKAGVSLAVGWVIYAVVAIGLASGFYFGRAPLVAAVPEMTRLYDLLGLEEEPFDLGLELREVKSVRRLIDGERVVVIEGLIVNLSNRDRQVPPLSASVTDAEGIELDRWTFHAESASLAPGATTRFETVAKNPPREGNLGIDFVFEP